MDASMEPTDLTCPYNFSWLSDIRYELDFFNGSCSSLDAESQFEVYRCGRIYSINRCAATITSCAHSESMARENWNSTGCIINSYQKTRADIGNWLSQ